MQEHQDACVKKLTETQLKTLESSPDKDLTRSGLEFSV